MIVGAHFSRIFGWPKHSIIPDEGITLHSKIPGGRRKSTLNASWVNAIKSCLHTRHSVKPEHQDRFWQALPATFDEYKQVTITNGDRVRTARNQSARGEQSGQDEGDLNHRDATFVRVSGRSPRTHYCIIHFL